MFKAIKTAAAAAVISCAGTPLLADKGVQVWGVKITDAPGLTFSWDDRHNLRARTLQAAPGDKNQFLGGATCWSNLTDVFSDFDIALQNPSGGALLFQPEAKVNGVIGHSTLTGFDPGDGDVMGNIWDQPDGGPTQETRFFDTDDLVLAYGFYNAGMAGSTPIQGHHQSYAYLTPSAQTWMGDVRAVDPATFDAATLRQMSFPGAHDAGMFTLAAGITSDSGMTDFIDSISAEVSDSQILDFLEGFAGKTIVQGVQNFSLTQKDPTALALKSGIRFFDYRPGTPVRPDSGLGQGTYYHVHAFVPGYDFTSFIGDVSTFLNDDANQHEIVIVNVKSSGMITEIFTPLYNSANPPETGYADAQAWIEANADFGDLAPIYTSAFSDVSDLTLGEIYQTNSRLIFYFGVGFNDSYPQNVPDDENPYDTWDVTNVMGALADELPTCQQDTDNFTVFQLQDTASSTVAQNWKDEANVWLDAVVSANGSVLLSTKGMWDYNTYPWVVGNLGTCQTMSVMLNDFAGNLLAYNAKTITAARMGIPIPDGVTGLSQAACSGLNQ
jgi:hypothetical protein